MTIATREAAHNKRGGYMVAVQGLPLWLATQEVSALFGGVVPVVSDQNDVFNAMRNKSATDIEEASDVPILESLLDTDAIEMGGASVDLLSSEYEVASCSVRAVLDATVAPLFAWRAKPWVRLSAAVSDGNAGGSATTNITVNGDVTGGAVGLYLYCARETWRVGAASYSSGTGVTTLTVYRGQCGTARDAIPAQTPVYLSPPYWAGRRMTLLRVFIDEGAEYETMWQGVVDRVQPDGSIAVTLEALDALSSAGAEVTIPLFRELENASVNSAIMDSGDGWLSLTLGVRGTWRDATLAPTGSVSVDSSLEYVQVGTEIMRATFGGLTVWGGTGVNDHVVISVADSGRGMFGSALVYPRGDESDAYAQLQNYDPLQGQPIYQLMVVEGHPVTVAARLLQGGTTGQTFSGLQYGGELSDSLIDTVEFDRFSVIAVPSIRIVVGGNGSGFSPLVLAQRAAAHAGCIIVPDSTGRLTCKKLGYRDNPRKVKTAINTDDIVHEAGGRERRIEATWPFEQLVGSVELATFADWLNDNEATTLSTIRSVEHQQYVRAGSVASPSASGVARLDAAFYPPGTDRTLGVNETLIMSERAQSYFDRYGRPAPVLTIPLRLSARQFGIGDVLTIDLTGQPVHDPVTGSRVTLGEEVIEVVGLAVDVRESVVTITCYLLGDEAGRFGVIAASGLVVSWNAGTRTVQLSTPTPVFVSDANDVFPPTLNQSEARHFDSGLFVRFYVPTTGAWRASGAQAYVEAYSPGANTLTLRASDLPAGFGADPPAAGDICEVSEWPTSRDYDNTLIMVHMAEGGQVYGGDDDTVDGVEMLPLAYPYAAGDAADEPFRVLS